MLFWRKFCGVLILPQHRSLSHPQRLRPRDSTRPFHSVINGVGFFTRLRRHRPPRVSILEVSRRSRVLQPCSTGNLRGWRPFPLLFPASPPSFPVLLAKTLNCHLELTVSRHSSLFLEPAVSIIPLVCLLFSRETKAGAFGIEHFLHAYAANLRWIPESCCYTDAQPSLDPSRFLF